MSKKLDRLLKRRDRLNAELAEIRVAIQAEKNSAKWTGRLSSRTANQVRYVLPDGSHNPNDIKSARLVASLGREFFAWSPNCGKGSLAELDGYLQSHALEWETDPLRIADAIQQQTRGVTDHWYEQRYKNKLPV